MSTCGCGCGCSNNCYSQVAPVTVNEATLVASADTFKKLDEVFTSSTSLTKTLTHAPLAVGWVEVYINNVRQPQTLFSLSGDVVTLTQTIAATDVVIISYVYIEEA